MPNDLLTAVEDFLERAGMTKAQWAASLGITHQRLSQILLGDSPPSLALALRMSETSGIRIEMFAFSAPDRRTATTPTQPVDTHANP